MMPKRPRQHQIEDLSRNAFEGALPEPWVYRPLVADYGVDGQVEIFDNEGRATGLIFNVQLKATDSKDITRSLKCTLKKSTCEYYTKHELPTLMVRYHVQSGSIFIRWFHQCSDIHLNSKQKSFTFSWNLSDLWSSSSSEYLNRSLERFRMLRTPSLKLPMNLNLEFDEKVTGKISEKIRIRLKAKDYSNYVCLLEKGSQSQWLLNIFVDIEKTKIELGGLSLVGLINQPFNDSFNVDDYLKDVFVLIGHSLCKNAHLHLGVEIIDSMVIESGFLKRCGDSGSDMILESVKWLSAADKVTKVISIAKRMVKKEDNYITGLITSLLVISKSKTVSESDFDQLVEFMKEGIERSINQNEYHAAAISHYNLGCMLRNRGHLAAALNNYKLASKLQPKYKNKDYYVMELAGLLFDMGRYLFSSKAYLTYYDLLEIKQEYCHELLADAFLFSGKYGQSLSEFDNFFKTKNGCLSRASNYEWKLKEMLCENIIQEYGCKEQKRMPKKAMMLAANRHEDSREQEEHLLKTLQVDYLGALTWFNLGSTYLGLNETENARDAFLTAALCQRNDSEAWVNALLLTFNLMTDVNVKEEGPLFQLILLSAYKIFGSEFLANILDALPTDAPVSLLMDSINKVCSELSGKSSYEEGGMKIRFFDPH
jgi:tetratricopeptide (TPR) repeat protein